MSSLFDQALEEVKTNTKVFEEKKDRLKKKFPGQYAVFSGGEFKKAYPSKTRAYEISCKKHGEGKFSIHDIDERPLSLGAMSFLAKGFDLS